MSEYFDTEIVCQCGCGIYNVSSKLMAMADNVRDYINRPIVANSICRCVIHNKAENGSDTSGHISTDTIECTAIDFKVNNSIERYEVVLAMVKAGFKRIGVAKGFVHGDITEGKAPTVMWTY